MTVGDYSLPEIVAQLLVAYGVGLWIWGWLRAKAPILRQRFHDCGTSIVIAATLTLYFVRDRELNFLDWLIVMFGPLFIVTALWRLTRTQSQTKS